MDLFYHYALYFAVYSIMGWVIETTYCSIGSRRFENRGFLIGPLCPIYACGSLPFILLMSQMPKMSLGVSILVTFLLGMLLTSTVEFFTGWLLEFLFKAKWWDYSHEKYNIMGKVCLKNSLFFGVMCVLLLYFIHPAISSAVGWLPYLWRQSLAVVFTILFCCDLVVSVITVLGLNKRLEGINVRMLAIKDKLDSFDWYSTFAIKERLQRLSELGEAELPFLHSVTQLHEEVKQIIQSNRSLQARVLKAFPNLRSLKYPEPLSAIKEQMARFKSIRLKSEREQSDEINPVPHEEIQKETGSV